LLNVKLVLVFDKLDLFSQVLQTQLFWVQIFRVEHVFCELLEIYQPIPRQFLQKVFELRRAQLDSSLQ
jgi:hypothetical protein